MGSWSIYTNTPPADVLGFFRWSANLGPDTRCNVGRFRLPADYCTCIMIIMCKSGSGNLYKTSLRLSWQSTTRCNSAHTAKRMSEQASSLPPANFKKTEGLLHPRMARAGGRTGRLHTYVPRGIRSGLNRYYYCP